MTSPPDDPAMVVTSASPGEQAAVGRALEAAGALLTEIRGAGSRLLLFSNELDHHAAAFAARQLRTAGWPAAVRPTGGGHLAAWRSHTAPVVIGARLRVYLPWSEWERPAMGDLIEVDPGIAFGTGSHPSTRLLLTALVERLQPGDAVLDVGCGTGVLALAAARLGAGCVVATDVEGGALRATRANAVRNGLEGIVVVPDAPLPSIDQQFDIVVANIGRDVLVALAPELVARVSPTGWIGLSGISPAQVDALVVAYAGMEVVATLRDDDWTALILRKVA